MQNVLEALTNTGTFSDDDHTITSNNFVIKVRDNKTGFLVAYSSIEADFDLSLDEFLGDYFHAE